MFFVLEGIDGAGCGTIRKATVNKLRNLGFKVNDLKYPWPEDPIGEVIYKFLKGKIKISPELQFLLYASQMVNDRERIKKLREEGVLLCDRYFSSTLCYQGVQGLDLERGLEFAKIFKIEVPKAIFFLKVSPRTAFDRKREEKGKENPDINERNLVFQEKVAQRFSLFAKRNVFAPWVTIDGEKPIDEVFDSVVNHIRRMIGENNDSRKDFSGYKA